MQLLQRIKCLREKAQAQKRLQKTLHGSHLAVHFSYWAIFAAHGDTVSLMIGGGMILIGSAILLFGTADATKEFEAS